MNPDQLLDFAHHIIDAVNSVSEEDRGYAIGSMQTAHELVSAFDAHWMLNAAAHLKKGLEAGMRNDDPEMLRRIGRASVNIADYTHDVYNDEDLTDVLDLIDHASNILAQSYRNPRRRKDAINLIGEVWLELGAIDRQRV